MLWWNPVNAGSQMQPIHRKWPHLNKSGVPFIINELPLSLRVCQFHSHNDFCWRSPGLDAIAQGHNGAICQHVIKQSRSCRVLQMRFRIDIIAGRPEFKHPHKLKLSFPCKCFSDQYSCFPKIIYVNRACVRTHACELMTSQKNESW